MRPLVQRRLGCLTVHRPVLVPMFSGMTYRRRALSFKCRTAIPSIRQLVPM